MLILPPGHAQEIRRRRQFSRREAWTVGAAAAMLAVIAVVLVVALATGEKTSANGCLHFSLPYSTGGATFDACGQRARDTCTAVGRSFKGAAGEAVGSQCRKAGLPVGAAVA